jgi:hypothetical protein
MNRISQQMLYSFNNQEFLYRKRERETNMLKISAQDKIK